MDKYIITYKAEIVKDMKDVERIIMSFNKFLSDDKESLLLMDEKVFDNVRIYKVDLINNSIEKMEIGGR